MTKTLVLLCGFDDGTVRSHMGVEHEGAVWLVTNWLVETASGFATPERMIRLGSFLEMESSRQNGTEFDYAVSQVPISLVADLLVPSETQFEVRSLPETPRVRKHDIRLLPAFP